MWNKQSHNYRFGVRIHLRNKSIIHRAGNQRITTIASSNNNRGLPCSAMIFYNLGEAEWVSVSCTCNLIENVFCEVKQISVIYVDQPATLNVCKQADIARHNRCYNFTWLAPTGTKFCSKNTKASKACSLENFSFLFNAIPSVPLPTITCDCLQGLKYHQFGGEVVDDLSNQTTVLVTGSTAKELNIGGNVFQCSNTGYISYRFVCDGKQDCPGETAFDEIDCPKACVQNASKCSLWFLYSTLQCKCHFLFHFDVLAETVPKISHEKQQQLCHKNSMLPCSKGCFDFADICVYKLDTNSELTPCMAGEHLENCNKFDCHLMVKCPSYYCVSWVSLCDGKWDCPHGVDESPFQSCNNNKACLQMLKCYNRPSCIHMAFTCDGNKDCFHGDDELDCPLWPNSCPVNCTCILYAAKCENITLPQEIFEEHLPFLKFVLLSCIFLSHLDTWNSRNLVDVSIVNSNFEQLCDISRVNTYLLHLDAGHNNIQSIMANCFSKNLRLRVLKLQNNSISKVHQAGFANLSSLIYLNLSHNAILDFEENILAQSTKLLVLSLLNCTLSAFQVSTFSSLVLSILEVSDYEVCCTVLSSAMCTATFPWYLECTWLVPTTLFQVFFYLMSIIIVVQSAISFLIQIISVKRGFQKSKAFPTVIKSVNVVELLLSSPLLILWIINLVHKENFILQERKWRSSSACHLVFFLMLYSTILSPTILSFVALTRLHVVQYPLESKFKETSFILKCILKIFLTTIIVPIIVTIVSCLVYRSVPFALCSPFQDPSHSNVLTTIVTGLSTLYQLSTIIFIITNYTKLLNELQKSQAKLKECVSNKKSNRGIFVQVIIVVGSNLLCWVPSGAIHFTLLFIHRYPIELLMWTTLLIIPLNSVVDPIVFIVTTLRSFKTKGSG